MNNRKTKCLEKINQKSKNWTSFNEKKNASEPKYEKKTNKNRNIDWCLLLFDHKIQWIARASSTSTIKAFRPIFDNRDKHLDFIEIIHLSFISSLWLFFFSTCNFTPQRTPKWWEIEKQNLFKPRRIFQWICKCFSPKILSIHSIEFQLTHFLILKSGIPSFIFLIVCRFSHNVVISLYNYSHS